MRRTALVLFTLLTIVVAAALTRPTLSADPVDDVQDARILVLESRVNALETQVAAAPGAQLTPTPAGDHTITGKVTIRQSTDGNYNFTQLPVGCRGAGGFADLQEGADVWVYDAGETLIAKGTIGASEYVRSEGCVLSFTVTDVPDSDFYQLKINTRDAPVYSMAEMEEMDWTVSLVIGS